MELSEKLKQFIKEQKWIFAKTYAKNWPHQYIVQERVDNDLFLELANHIDSYGYESYFYKMKQIYFDYNGYTYWHMENDNKSLRRARHIPQTRTRRKTTRRQKKLKCNHF